MAQSHQERLKAKCKALRAAGDELHAALEMYAASTCCDGDGAAAENHEEKCPVGRALVRWQRETK